LSQNTSHAVMAQRAEPHDSLDDFPTPPWATRALLEHVIMLAGSAKAELARSSAWEPACNRGFMVDPLGEYFGSVWATDVHDYGREGMVQHDFLFPTLPSVMLWAHTEPDWIITNPPFRLAEQFVARASQLAKRGFAFLVRTSFLEGVGRYENLFSKNPPSIVAQFSERVPMVKGRYDPEASTATSYCWLVWIDGETGTRLVWIPPCRRQLERESDWPAKSEA
jgi:hypothetical protein